MRRVAIARFRGLLSADAFGLPLNGMMTKNMATETSITLTLESREEAVLLFGSRDQYLRMIRDALGVRIVARGDVVHIEGTEIQVDQADRVFQQLRADARRSKKPCRRKNVRTVLAVVGSAEDRPSVQTRGDGRQHGASKACGRAPTARPATSTPCATTTSSSPSAPPAPARRISPSAWPSTCSRQGAVKKIVLVRPAVEAGERLGFLPGDIVAKINPYLRPLFDALNDMMEPEQVKRYMENDIIEIAPLAFMRGRTLNNAVIILDEGQNTTIAADEDVPDAHGPRLEDHRHRRHHAGRSAARNVRSGLIDADPPACRTSNASASSI